ncbi:MAG: hypothetical protein P0116_13455 [Candidatus Nitrosocosmicus sp.]|nr:hypothetical protein [Candidatus Nitrosocosmicus sp.]
MMEATKEKTRQVISNLDKNNSNASVTVESASASSENIEQSNRTLCGPRAAKQNTTESESAASSMNPVMGYGPESIQVLLTLKGYSSIKQNTEFNTIFDYVTDDSFFANVMTARDDKVCKKYCRPLDGVI